MAKMIGKNQTFSLNGNDLTCLQTVSTSEALDVLVIECAGATSKEKVMGLSDITCTLTIALETNDVTMLGYIAPNASGAVVWNMNGATTGDISITSTNATVSDRTISNPVNGFATAAVTIQFDDITIGAVV